VNILLGKGDGTFHEPVSNDTGDSSPGRLAVGDFNGDGKLDLVVAGVSGNSGTVSLLLGKGNGTFQIQTVKSNDVGIYAQSVAVGDFNGDGHLDLAVVDLDVAGFAGTLSVLLGKGDGTFQAPQSYDAGFGANPMAVGDFNGDGHPDLAVGNFGNYGGTGSVSVWLGKGDGTFETGQSSAAGTSPGSMVVGDFNGDGKLDVVTDQTILLGNGDGTFKSPLTFAPGGSFAMGDFNRDGHPDLGVANSTSNTVSILLGKGDGTFQATPHYAAGPGPWFIVAGDFNSDGHPDLATADISSNTVSILLGKGDGTFQDAKNYVVGMNPESLAVGDFNADGHPDLAVASTNDNAISVLLGNGDGTFQDAQNYTVSSSYTTTAVAVGDFNADGHLDIAANDGRNVIILLGNGDGSFQAPQSNTTGSNYPFSLVVGDFNGDGKLDVAAAGDSGGLNSMGTVIVLLGRGDGTFQDFQNYAVAADTSNSVAVGDFNGDGKLDLAVGSFDFANQKGMVIILVGKGDGTFQAAQNFAVRSFPQSVVMGDFNGDGHPDLAVADGTAVTILLGKGDGTFQDAQSYAAGLSSQSLTVGDFNGDGFPDVAQADETGVSVLLNAADWGPGSLPPPLGRRVRNQIQEQVVAVLATSEQEGLHPLSLSMSGLPPAAVWGSPLGIQTTQPGASLAPRHMATGSHAQDTVFERWHDLPLDLLAWNLLR
jgi:hypothetical protein